MEVIQGAARPHEQVNVPFGQKLMLRDGVTTPLDLEVGTFPVERFYGKLEDTSRANYGASVSTMGVREKIFNPKTVKDNSTPKQAGLPSTGIPYVIVNGTVVVKDSKVLKGVYPGRAVRLPVQM